MRKAPKWGKVAARELAERVAKSTLQSVGDELGLTRERVRQIITKHVDPLMIEWLRIRNRPEEKSQKQKAIDKLYSLSKRNKETGCVEWQGLKAPSGYGVTSYRGERAYAHRLAWTFAHGEIPRCDSYPGTMCVCHKCDNPPCINPDHLFIGSMKDNMSDRDAKFRGGKWGNADTRRFDHKKIKWLIATGRKCQEVADFIGCHINTIYRLRDV